MNVTSRHRIAVVAAAIGLLLSTGLTSADATTSPYRGTLTYGRQTAHVHCTGSPAVPTSITYTVAYDATHWNTSAPMTINATYDYYDPYPVGSGDFAPPVQETIPAGQAGTITATLVIPSYQSGYFASIFVGDQGQLAGPFLSFPLTCASPVAPSFRVPTVGTITHPCLGVTTARVTNGSSLTWTVEPVIEPASSTGTPTEVSVPAGSSKTITVGRALHGAEHFVLFADASNTNPAEGTYASTPLILYSAACIPGHPATTFTATHSRSHDVLVTTIKPAIPGGAHVSFYRVSGSTRTLVGTGTTGPRGISSVSINHRASACYLAVVHATHYSLRTTTATRCVN
jgi:hypothetical protein